MFQAYTRPDERFVGSCRSFIGGIGRSIRGFFFFFFFNSAVIEKFY